MRWTRAVTAPVLGRSDVTLFARSPKKLIPSDSTGLWPEVVEIMKTYEVHAQPSGRFWHSDVPAIEQVTQARSIKEIEVMARDLIEIMTETCDFDMDIRLNLPSAVNEHRRRAQELRSEELRLRAEAAGEMRAAALALRNEGLALRNEGLALRNEGLALRDVGALLGVSTARAGQLVGTGR